jgi:hypothetical protein
MKKILFVAGLLSSNAFAASHFYRDLIPYFECYKLMTIMRIDPGMIAPFGSCGVVAGLSVTAVKSLVTLLLRRNVAFDRTLFAVVTGGTAVTLYFCGYYLLRSPWALNAMFHEATSLTTAYAHDKAIVLYELAAIGGHTEAQWRFGLFLYCGCNIAQNRPEAARYLGLAAAQGNAIAQCFYGMCYLGGDGVPQDAIKAARYFRLAADQGNVGGQYCYGMCLRDGEGVAPDAAGAAHYLGLAAAQGYARATATLAALQNAQLVAGE